MKWMLVFEFLVNDNGILTVNVDFPENEYSFDPKITEQKGLDLTQFKNEQSRKFEESRTNALERIKQECVPQLKHDIARVHQFTLPGHGTFLYKNPVWTGMGDLMVDVDYVQ